MNGFSGGILCETGHACEVLARRLCISHREAEVLWWVLGEKSNDEIAAALGVSSLTVKTHLQNLFRRLRVRGKVGLAVVGTRTLLQAGLPAPLPEREPPPPSGPTGEPEARA